MNSTASSRGSRAAKSSAGYSLVELLVATLLSGAAMAMLVRDFGYTVNTRHEMDMVVETQHGLQASLDIITQELRQAGACLPSTGDFVALDGEDNGQTDRLTLRIGRTDPTDVTCIWTVLEEAAPSGSSVLTVGDTTGFEADQWVYLTGTTGAGQAYRLGAVDDDTLTLGGTLSKSLPVGGGVYAIEERVYEVDNSAAEPVLTVAVDGGEPQPMVRGVETFDIQYRLAPCPPCAAVDEPADDLEWRLVRELSVRVVVRSAGRRHSGEYVRIEDATHVKPRNLI